MQKSELNPVSPDTPIWLNNFVEIYQSLSKNNLDLLLEIYDKNIIFIDPIHQVEGIDELYKYFQSLYENLTTCDFIIEHIISSQDQAAIYWKMTYQHSKLNKGELVEVYGNSLIKGEGSRVLYHRDYLDLGAMLYEQIPVFGSLTKWIKNKASR